MAKYALASRVKLKMLKVMESVGTTASNMASSAKIRANEINLENRRREILTDFSLRAFQMWQKGVPLPGSLSEMLSELSEIEDKLSVLRAQKYAKVPIDPSAEAPAADAPADPGVACAIEDADGGESQSVPCEVWETPADSSEPPEAEATPQEDEVTDDAPDAATDTAPAPDADTDKPQA